MDYQQVGWCPIHHLFANLTSSPSKYPSIPCGNYHSMYKEVDENCGAHGFGCVVHCTLELGEPYGIDYYKKNVNMLRQRKSELQGVSSRCMGFSPYIPSVPLGVIVQFSPSSPGPKSTSIDFHKSKIHNTK
jgi:hypothetical protein